jgi:hypothetical protein
VTEYTVFVVICQEKLFLNMYFIKISVYLEYMAKRAATNTKNKTSRSKKTKKRLETKRLRLLAKGK